MATDEALRSAKAAETMTKSFIVQMSEEERIDQSRDMIALSIVMNDVQCGRSIP